MTVPGSGHTVLMRVISGSARGRKIVVPDGTHTRPTADRVREAMFNSLYSLDAVEGAVVLDLFAGSGALGIEALSRGAAHVTFVESDRHALAAIRENLDTLGFADVSTVVAGDGLAHIACSGHYDLVMLDPPYGFDQWDELLSLVHDADVVIESDREVELPDSWRVHRERRYGSTVVTLATASPTSGSAPS